ncbi:MFS transporter [Streptosporangium sp. NPDC000396]|uniref:MFS transporter n=1 Tax=Streptosporangium sp. NPDC000396 TaxID=3366185 RepID=UPI0036751046
MRTFAGVPTTVVDVKTFQSLVAVGGSRRYSAALLVDALGAGLLRPFLLLYGVAALGMSVAAAGVALSAGLLAGLAALPYAGRLIDRAGGRPMVVASMLARFGGVVALLVLDSPAGFVAAAVLLGLGAQVWPASHAALVTELVEGRARDTALAAGRALRNAGLGAGALLATLALAGGTAALKTLAVATGTGYLVAALLVLRTPASRPTAHLAVPGPGGSGNLGRGLLALYLLNLPYALTFDVLEVALPAVLVEQLHVSPAWSSGIFVGNTVLVIALQVWLVTRLADRPRRSVLALSGLLLASSYALYGLATLATGSSGAAAVALVSVVYTIGEILYTGSGPALVIATAPPGRVGRALARFELSTGIGRALAPAVLTALFSLGHGILWIALAAATGLAAAGVRRLAPPDARTAEPHSPGASPVERGHGRRGGIVDVDERGRAGRPGYGQAPSPGQCDQPQG